MAKLTAAQIRVLCRLEKESRGVWLSGVRLNRRCVAILADMQLVEVGGGVWGDGVRITNAGRAAVPTEAEMKLRRAQNEARDQRPLFAHAWKVGGGHEFAAQLTHENISAGAILAASMVGGVPNRGVFTSHLGDVLDSVGQTSGDKLFKGDGFHFSLEHPRMHFDGVFHFSTASGLVPRDGARGLGIEVNGGRRKPGGGRHGSDEDLDRDNLALALGYPILRFTPDHLRDDPATCVEATKLALIRYLQGTGLALAPYQFLYHSDGSEKR